MRLWTILLPLLFVIGACSKQSPSEVESDYVDSISELERGEACRELNLTKDLLELNNTKNLFKCTTWNEKFPVLYQSLTKINVEKWNRLSQPVNELFFNNTINRDLMIDIIKEMDEKEGLDEFAKVITSLSDSNFFGNINDLFKCSKENNDCDHDKQLTREDLVHFFSFFKMSSEDLDKGSDVLSSFIEMLSKTEMTFFKALSKDLGSEKFVESRYELVNQFILKFDNDNFKDELEFLRNIFKNKNSEGQSKLLEIIVNKMNKDEYSYLINYPVNVDSDQWKDFKVLDQLLKADIKCEGFLGDRAMTVDVSEHLNVFIKELFAKDRDNFFAQSIESLGVLKTAQNLCANFSTYSTNIINPLTYQTEEHRLDYVKAVSKTTKLLMYSSYYELFDFFQDAVPERVENKELFLIKFFSTNYHVSFVELVSSLNELDSNLMGSVYDLLTVLDEKTISNIIYYMEWLLDKDDEQIKALAKVWSSLSKEGQFFFFNFLDSHYKDDIDVRLLFSFYSTLLGKFSPEIATVLNDYIVNIDLSLNSLEEITQWLGGSELVEDYRRFFSRDHFIEMIKIVSRGNVEIASESYLLDFNPDQKQPLPVKLDLNVITTSDQGRVDCLNSMNENSSDFYDLITTIPAACEKYVDDNVFYQFIKEVNVLGSHMYGKDYRWNRYSLFSTDMMKSGTLLLKHISQNYESAETEGIVAIVSSLSEYIENIDRRNDLVKTLDIINQFNSSKEVSSISAFTTFYSRNENFKYLSNLFAGTTELLNLSYDYHEGLMDEQLSLVEFKEDRNYNCENFNSMKVGGRACPSKEEVVFIKNSLISKILKKNDENKPALDLLLEVFLPANGLKIPLDSNDQVVKRISIGETFSMLYDLTNKSVAANSTNIEYQEIPRAIDAYFSDEWEIDSDMMDDAPEETNVSMNTMERIETVIRDVRFDENYLGAHYMNSVAKAENYDEVVDSKYSLLGFCVPLKFCGKFMDKAQHRLGRNSERTFPGLIDVNKEENWKYGDFMRALLQVVVASSPDDSQVSSVINRRILGINIAIPILNSKKDLIHHNGKILTDLSMVSAFSNAARVLRDRVGKSNEEFDKFKSSKRLTRFDNYFLKNERLEEFTAFIKNLILKSQSNGLIDRVISFFYGKEYTQQRLIENIGVKVTLLSTYINDKSLSDVEHLKRYEALRITQLEPVVTWIIDNYDELSKVIPLEDVSFLGDVNYLLDLLLFELENKNTQINILINELSLFIVKNQRTIIKDLNKIVNNSKLNVLKDSIAAASRLLKSLESFDERRELILFLEDLRINKNVDFSAIQKWFAINNASEVCYSSKCEKNIARYEINKLLNYLLENKSSRLFQSVNYVALKKQRDFDLLLKKIFSSITIQ